MAEIIDPALATADKPCELGQSQKCNVGELPNVKMFADVSSEDPSSESKIMFFQIKSSAKGEHNC